MAKRHKIRMVVEAELFFDNPPDQSFWGDLENWIKESKQRLSNNDRGNGTTKQMQIHHVQIMDATIIAPKE